MTNVNDAPPPPPLVLPVDAARALADAAWVIPCEVLYAVREVITDAIRRLETELRDRPRRRGNSAKRAQIDKDWGSWSGIRDELTARSCCSPYVHHDGCLVGAVPDLGMTQWRIVASYASGWEGSPEQLFLVARGIAPEDEPVDWTPWRVWSRRRRWTCTASAAQERSRSKRVEADYAEESARHLLQQAADTQLRAIECRREAGRLEEEAEPHRLALELDDAGLAAYEAAIDAGVAPLAALQSGRRSAT